MAGKRRDSSEQQQERESRKQLERVFGKDWITTDVAPDLGEDFLVRIYEAGVSTGLSFYIQLKSTGDITKHTIKSGKIISYPFEVKDLQHWEAHAVAMILAVWDVQQERGWWIWINQAVEFLGENNPTWRQKAKVNVHISSQNEFNEAGLPKLRHLLANIYYPIVSKGKDLTINAKFSFPQTPDGKAKFAEFQKHFATGDEVELDAKYIEALDFSDWWKRLYGETDPNTRSVKIGPAKAKAPHPAQIEFLSETVKEKIPYIELWNVKQGEEEATLTNEHQNIPIKFIFVISKTSPFQMNIAANPSNMDSVSLLHMLKIGQVLSEGGNMKLTLLDTGDVIQLPIPSGKFPAPSQRIIDFVENLSFIQNSLGKKLIFPDDDSFDSEDVEAANELVSIIQKGHYQQSNMTFLIQMLKPGIEILLEKHKDGQPLYFQASSESSFVEILSEKIELGPMVQKIKGYWDMPLEEVQIWLEQAKDSDTLEVNLVNVELFEEFEKWQILKRVEG